MHGAVHDLRANTCKQKKRGFYTGGSGKVPPGSTVPVSGEVVSACKTNSGGRRQCNAKFSLRSGFVSGSMAAVLPQLERKRSEACSRDRDGQPHFSHL